MITNSNDVDDAARLRELARQVDDIRRGFTHSRGGCACSADGLCAYHAAVFNDLAEVARGLQRAMDDLTRRSDK